MDNDALIGTSPRNPAFPSQDVLHTLKTTHVPVLHLGADHDIICPVENWVLAERSAPDVNARDASESRPRAASSASRSGGRADCGVHSWHALTDTHT